MANKMKKFLAWVMVLTLLAGQIAIPATAETTADPAPSLEVTVDVSAVLPEAPAGESQIPAGSDSVAVSAAEPVTTSTPDPAAGVTEQSTSTTTTWSGSEGGTATSGTETTTTVTGTDNITGQTLYEGGSTSGSEVSITNTEEIVESVTEENYVTKEIITSETDTESQEGSSSFTEESSSTETGEWINTQASPEEGAFKVTDTNTWSESDTTLLGEEEIGQGGIEIGLTPDNKASDPDNGIYTFTGTGTGAILSLEEGMEIPENATLVTDDAGNIIGYTLETVTETITDTKIQEGTAKQNAAGSSTDTTGTTSAAAPDLDAAAEKLNIRIDDNSRITEETDGSGKVTAYVVTNTTEEAYELDGSTQLVIPEAGIFPQADGSTKTVTVEEGLDADGNKTIKVIHVYTDANGKEYTRNEKTQTIIRTDLPTAAPPANAYILPPKPAASVSTENGITTTVTVTDILDADGTVIGYKSTTVKTDAAGAELYREENNLLGTEETITDIFTVTGHKSTQTATVKETITEINRITAEETIYEDIAAYTRLNKIVNEMTVDKTQEVVMIDGKLYYIYTGSVTVSEGDGHGDISLMNPVTPMSSLMNANSKLDLEDGGNGINGVSSNAPQEGFKYIGSGVNTALSINKGSGSSGVEQFRLKSSDGKVYYAMCIDFDTYIQSGHLYDIKDITSEDYYQESGALSIASAEKIRSVALNGYWGTESDVGSMEDVQTFLTAYLTALDADNNGKADLTENQIKDIISKLTPGRAQAATQAALWKFGNKNQYNTINEKDLVTGNDKEDETITRYLYDALLAAANDPNEELEADEGVEFLDAEDITATSIVVKEKVASADDEGNTSKKNVYNTDLNFTLGIEPTKLFGDLKVTVYDSNGNEIKTAILANKDNTLIGLKPDANGMYTISDIEIAEGISVNLKLHGTQDLGTGVYIYTSLEGTFKDSQTLVTLATGSRKVDLDIEMKLDVQEPTVTREISGETQHGTRTDTQEQSRTDITTRKSTTTTNDWTREHTTETETELVYTSDVTLTRVSAKQTREEKSWISSWIKFFAPVPAQQDGDTPVEDSGDDTPEVKKLKKKMIIEDENIPLAKAPKTGDLSAIWLAVSGLSLGGAALLNRKRRDDEE